MLKSKIRRADKGNALISKGKQGPSRLRKAFIRAKAAYYTLGTIFVAAASLYIMPPDKVSFTSPKLESAINNYQIEVSNILLGIGKQAEDTNKSLEAPTASHDPFQPPALNSFKG